MGESIMSWLGNMLSPITGEFIKDVGDTVKQFVTTDKDELELRNALEKLQMDYNAKVLDIGVQYEQLAAKNAGDINSTMQAEATAEHWPTYSWRPFIGFAVGIMGLIMGVTTAVVYIGVMIGEYDAKILEHLPQMLFAMAGVMATLTPILGVASWFRGKMQADPTIPTINKG